MNRLARRVLVATVALLLVWVSAASAECAWVLWDEFPTVFRQPGVRGMEGLSIVEAFDTKSACEAAAMFHAKRQEAETRADASYTKVTRKGTWVFWESDIAVGSYRYRCLPDAIDPRAPKGTGR
jgi:hypothetical protein